MAKERHPFNTGDKFFAARAFKFHGRNYAVGDVFPWRKLSCSLRKLRTLHDGKFIDCGERGYSDPVKEEAAAKVADAPNAPPVDDDTGDEGSPSPLEFDPEVHEIDNETRGEWYITKDGERIARLRPVVAKKLRKATEVMVIDDEDLFEEEED